MALFLVALMVVRRGWWLLSGVGNIIYNGMSTLIISPPITINEDKQTVQQIDNNNNNKETIIKEKIIEIIKPEYLPPNYKEIANNLNDEQLKTIAQYLNINNIEKEKIAENLLKSDIFLKLITNNHNTIIKQYYQDSDEKIKILQQQLNELNDELKLLKKEKFNDNKWHEKIQFEINNLTQFVNNKFNNLISDTKNLIIKEIIHSTTDISSEKIKSLIDEKLKIYDADKTGLVDYAMEPMGGQIITTRCTETYQAGTAVVSIMGIPLWYHSNTPRTVITPGINPGECWAFQNFPGFLVIKLANPIKITAFSLEHISKLLIPNGKIDSAPKNFEVWAMNTEDDKEPIKLGEYIYDIMGEALQFFPVQIINYSYFEYVELKINSNHGNPNYSCLYRFRVHGNVT